MGIGDRLRARRQAMGLTRTQLAQKIQVTPSAIANYENGVSYPKPDILISLILALEVDANYLYQDYLPHAPASTAFDQELTPEEQNGIRQYRALNDHGQRMVQVVLSEEYARSQGARCVDYPCLLPGARKLHSGFLMNASCQNIRFEVRYLPEGTDFCFQIQIDRYEPVYKKYDVVALKNAPAKHNEIGLFHINEVYYLRTFCKTEEDTKLRSLNADEPDIHISKEDAFECLGTVIGRIDGPYKILSLPE